MKKKIPENQGGRRMGKNRKRDENQLLGKDFVVCRDNLKGIIVAPFKSENAKGIGYNFTSSWLVYSITRGKMLKSF